MAELHVVGEIVGAHGFEDRNLFCKVLPCSSRVPRRAHPRARRVRAEPFKNPSTRAPRREILSASTTNDSPSPSISTLDESIYSGA